jgi:hypothetical protein
VGIEYDVITESRDLGSRLTMGGPLRWLTTRGHLDPLVQREAPAEVLATLDVIHRSLGGNARLLATKHAQPLGVDLLGPNGVPIELDEVQHFTSARRDSLRWYPGVTSLGFTLGFSIDQYRSLIDLWRAKANAVFTRQLGADFDFQGGRRAQRAYFDAVKDLLAPTFTGATLVRIPVLDRDPRAAALAICSRVG